MRDRTVAFSGYREGRSRIQNHREGEKQRKDFHSFQQKFINKRKKQDRLRPE